jgi:hypothetical protein
MLLKLFVTTKVQSSVAAERRANTYQPTISEHFASLVMPCFQQLKLEIAASTGSKVSGHESISQRVIRSLATPF